MPFFVSQSVLDRLQSIDGQMVTLRLQVQKLIVAADAEKERDAMSQKEIDALRESVAKNTSVVASAVEVMRGLSQQIADAADDPEQIKALAAEIDQNAKKLAEAIAASTSSGPLGGITASSGE
jgi:phage-related tail protein